MQYALRCGGRLTQSQLFRCGVVGVQLTARRSYRMHARAATKLAVSVCVYYMHLRSCQIDSADCTATDAASKTLCCQTAKFLAHR